MSIEHTAIYALIAINVGMFAALLRAMIGG